ncbi:AAA family ATPase [Micromonospora haikouensis]|uniref:AAA family ATPase n=1 Tax=Micromonospora haikouensis TaxID=686309 RepID=UPI0037B93179
MQPPPVVYLLVGLPGSGKSTYARTLERDGVLRLSVDEQMMTRHGRLGKDYPTEQHLDLLGPVVDAVRRQLITAVKSGRTVVLDHGLGRRSERDEYKQLVTSLGATWRLLHFQVERDELLRRLAVRNESPGYGVIDPEVLDWIATASEEPHDEGEEISRPGDGNYPVGQLAPGHTEAMRVS